jgi:hypothetical protein
LRDADGAALDISMTVLESRLRSWRIDDVERAAM